MRINEFYKEIIHLKESSASRGALVTYLFLVIFLFLSVLSVTYIIHLSADKSTISDQKIESFVKYFYTIPEEKSIIPDSSLIIGNSDASIKIVIFTDFFCTACYEFYELEKYLFPRYKGDIKVVYYNFPLDKICNQHAPRTLYSNSCIISKSVIALSKIGLFYDFLVYHYEHYKENIDKLKSGDVMISLNGFFKEKNISKISIMNYQKIMNSAETELILNNDIECAQRIKIKAVPTIFIKNRRLEGIPRPELVEAVIRKELGRD